MRQSVADDNRNGTRRRSRLPLPRFTVAGWSAESVGGYGTGSSDGWVYRDALGRLLEVEVVPSDSDVGEEQQRAVFNMRRPSPEPVTAMEGIHPPEVERTHWDVRLADLPWRTGTIVIDGVPTPFETLDLGSDFWVAVAPLADCVLILRSHGVAQPDVALVRATH
jgi:hypothetical protein